MLKISKKNIIFSLQLFIAAILICFLTSCGSVSTKPVDYSVTDSPKQFLPFEIKWIANLFDKGRQDSFRPIEMSSPTVYGKYVFVGSSHGHMYCLNRQTGSLVWKFKAYGGVESAGAIYEQSIIFGDSDGNLYSVRISDGFTNWVYKARGQVMGRVIVVDNKAIFSTTFNRVYAVDAINGKWLWTHQRALPEGFSIYGVPTPKTDGNLVYAGFADGYLVAMDLERGREVWKSLLVQSETFTDVDAEVVFEGDRLYISGYDGILYCLKKDDGNIIWKTGIGGISKVALYNDKLLFADDKGFLQGLNKSNGEILWKVDIRNEDAKKSLAKSLRRKLKIPTGPVIYGKKVLCASSSGYFYVVDPDTGNIDWTYLPGFGVSSELVVKEDGVFFVSNSAMAFKMAPSQYPPPLF